MPGKTGEERFARAVAAPAGPVPAYRETAVPGDWETRSAESARIGAGNDAACHPRIASNGFQPRSASHETSRKSVALAHSTSAGCGNGSSSRALFLDAIDA